MDEVYDYAIIGAGLSGLYLAIELSKKNKSYIILEKSNNRGGRFAYRRLGEHVINYGVSSFEWDGEFFKDFIQRGINDGDLLFDKEIISPKTHFNAWTKKIARELHIQKFKVDHACMNNGYVELKSDLGELVRAKSVISTCPAPQSYELFKNIVSCEKLLQVQYEKKSFYFCTSENEHLSHTSLTFKKKSYLDGLWLHEFEVNDWIDDENRDALKVRVDDYFKNDILESFAHKWRYSTCIETTSISHKESIIFCGDYMFQDSGLLASWRSCQAITLA